MSKASPTLTGDLRKGEETNFWFQLQRRGIKPDDIAARSSDDPMFDEVAFAILKRGLFTLPEEQVKRLLEINEQVWKDPGITKAAIRAAGDPPECPPSDEHGLYCVTLFHETGDALTTFMRNWAACVFVHGEYNTFKWDGLVFTPKGVKPRAGAKPRPAGLRWALAELGRLYKGTCVRDVWHDLDAKSVMGVGQELPAIAALHPRWATSTNGRTIPFVEAPDLEVAPNPGWSGFDSAPCLDLPSRDDMVYLSYYDVEESDPRRGSGSLW